jgi:hypothetical protein
MVRGGSGLCKNGGRPGRILIDREQEALHEST